MYVIYNSIFTKIMCRFFFYEALTPMSILAKINSSRIRLICIKLSC